MWITFRICGKLLAGKIAYKKYKKPQIFTANKPSSIFIKFENIGLQHYTIFNNVNSILPNFKVEKFR